MGCSSLFLKEKQSNEMFFKTSATLLGFHTMCLIGVHEVVAVEGIEPPWPQRTLDLQSSPEPYGSTLPSSSRKGACRVCWVSPSSCFGDEVSACCTRREDGGSEGSRTPDPDSATVVLYQLSYTPSLYHPCCFAVLRWWQLQQTISHFSSSATILSIELPA